MKEKRGEANKRVADDECTSLVLADLDHSIFSLTSTVFLGNTLFVILGRNTQDKNSD